LRCDVDFNVPPTGVTTPVRFVAANDVDQDGNTIPVVHYFRGVAPAAPTLTYQNISAFILCGDDHINGGCCPIPSATTAQHVLDLSDTTPADRFFLFYLSAEAPQAQANLGHVASLQGALWRRNGVGVIPVYQWGSQ